VVGDAEVADDAVTVSAPGSPARSCLPVPELVERLVAEIAARRRDRTVAG
jgi:threonyl-tRNA synthetase